MRNCNSNSPGGPYAATGTATGIDIDKRTPAPTKKRDGPEAAPLRLMVKGLEVELAKDLHHSPAHTG
jgi:hypothetical protein